MGFGRRKQQRPPCPPHELEVVVCIDDRRGLLGCKHCPEYFHFEPVAEEAERWLRGRTK